MIQQTSETHDLYYVRPEDVSQETLVLRRDEVHHLTKVCRKRVGDSFSAVDGRGHSFLCLIEEIGGQQLIARVVKRTKFVREPYFQLSVAMAVPRKSRFEWFVEKGTEIGLAAFTPTITQRCLTREKPINVKRCRRIALAAMKQCKRSVLPEIGEPRSFTEVMRHAASFDVKLIAHEKSGSHSLDDILKARKSAGRLEYCKTGILCIGPEGGFTDEEVSMAEEHGFKNFGLGSRRLRTETAGLIGAALVLDRMGELS